MKAIQFFKCPLARQYLHKQVCVCVCAGVCLCVCVCMYFRCSYSIQINFHKNQFQKEPSRQVEWVKPWLKALEKLMYK